MKKIFILCLALSFLAVFSTGDLIAAEKAKPVKQKASAKRSVKVPVPKVIETFLGVVAGIDTAEKTLAVRARYAAEYYFDSGFMMEKEFVLDEDDITFDISEAKFAGCGPQSCAKAEDFKTGDHVRVAYERKGDKYIANIVLRIGKR